MTNEDDRHGARDALVHALTIFLQSARKGALMLDQRSALFQARGVARRVLTAAEYDEAIFQVFREAGIDL